MGLYNFQPRFVDAILAGGKTHTIRALRHRPDVPGCTMHLYTGLRTKKVRLLFRAVCVRRETIHICLNPDQVMSAKADSMGLNAPWAYQIQIAGQILSDDEKEALARRDGFPNLAEMMKFWKGRLPFDGHIFHWTVPANASPKSIEASPDGKA